MGSARLVRLPSAVGYDGPSEPAHSVLRDFHIRHLALIAFDGLGPFLARPVSIDSDAIQAKLVKGRRGGGCHEQNSLFHDMLAGIGFAVTALGGRVVWMRPSLDTPEDPSPHARGGVRRALRRGCGVRASKPSFAIAARARAGAGHLAQRLPRDARRRRHELQIRARAGWTPLHHFTLDVLARSDFELAKWFVSTHPRTLFVCNLVAARLVCGTRVTLLNASISVRHPDGNIGERRLTGAVALRGALENTMGLALPVPAKTIWARLPERLVAA